LLGVGHRCDLTIIAEYGNTRNNLNFFLTKKNKFCFIHKLTKKFFCVWYYKWGRFQPRLLDPEPQPQEGRSISLKYYWKPG